MRRLAFIGLVLVSAPVFAGNGTTGASSLRLASGARAPSMGEAFVAVADGADSLGWNPAGLSGGPPQSLYAGFQPMAENVSVSQLGGAARFGKFGLGGGYGSVSAAKLDAFDSVGNRTGSFDAKDQTFMLAGSYGGPQFAAGVTGKFWSSQIDGKSASAAMADLGLTFQNPFVGALRHGLVIRHIGGSVSYISQKDPLPTTMVFGTAVHAGRRLLLSGDYGVERAIGGYFAVGAEWAAVTAEKFGLALRGGYNTRRKDAGSLSGASVGAGLSWRSVSLDYAWVPFGDIGDAHSFTLRMKFDGRSSDDSAAASRKAAPVGSKVPAVKSPPAPAEACLVTAPPPSATPPSTTKGKIWKKKSHRSPSNTLESVPTENATVH